MDNHTWEILSLYTIPSKDGLTNIVDKINWRFQITEDKYYGDVYGHTKLPAPSGDSFTAYDDLSEETIINWVKEREDGDAIIAKATAKLEENKTPPVVEKNPPWTYPITVDGTEKYMIVVDNQPNDLTKMYGPLFWDSKKINEGLKYRGFSDLSVPSNMIVFRKGLLPTNEPLTLSDRVKIYKAEYTPEPTFDELTQTKENLSWSTETGKAVGTYRLIDKTLDEIKKSVKEKARLQRINSLIDPAEMTLNENTVKVYQDEQTCIVTYNKANIMNDSETINWKLVDSWINASKSDLLSIHSFIQGKIQSAYDAEYDLNNQINGSTSIEQLKNINNSITGV